MTAKDFYQRVTSPIVIISENHVHKDVEQNDIEVTDENRPFFSIVDLALWHHVRADGAAYFPVWAWQCLSKQRSN